MKREQQNFLEKFTGGNRETPWFAYYRQEKFIFAADKKINSGDVQSAIANLIWSATETKEEITIFSGAGSNTLSISCSNSSRWKEDGRRDEDLAKPSFYWDDLLSIQLIERVF